MFYGPTLGQVHAQESRGKDSPRAQVTPNLLQCMGGQSSASLSELGWWLMHTVGICQVVEVKWPWSQRWQWHTSGNSPGQVRKRNSHTSSQHNWNIKGISSLWINADRDWTPRDGSSVYSSVATLNTNIAHCLAHLRPFSSVNSTLYNEVNFFFQEFPKFPAQIKLFLWTLWWERSVELEIKDFPHSLHSYGLNPAWTLWW